MHTMPTELPFYMIRGIGFDVSVVNMDDDGDLVDDATGVYEFIAKADVSTDDGDAKIDIDGVNQGSAGLATLSITSGDTTSVTDATLYYEVRFTPTAGPPAVVLQWGTLTLRGNVTRATIAPTPAA